MNSCCFIGHRNFTYNKEYECKFENLIENLILNEKVDTFLFGSASEFDNFCYNVVSKLKNKFSNVVRIFVRAEYPIISNDYYNHLKTFYEESYFYLKKLNFYNSLTFC